MTDTDIKRNQYINEYVREKYKRISLNIENNYFYNELLPIIEKSGYPVITWIKQAIKEKALRDKDK